MPAHVIYPQGGSESCRFFAQMAADDPAPAIRSFDGLVFSDDLTMEAASFAGGITARVAPP